MKKIYFKYSEDDLRRSKWRTPKVINLNGVDYVTTDAFFNRDHIKEEDFIGEIEWANASQEWNKLKTLKNPFYPDA